MDEAAAVRALDDAWNLAYQRKDMAMLAGVLADDWTGFLADGRAVSKPELLAAVPGNPDGALSFDRVDFHLYGDTATTRGRLSVDGRYIQSFLRIYARRGGTWQAVCVQVVP